MEKAIEYILRKLPFIGKKLGPHMREVLSGAAIAFSLRVFGAGLGICFSFLLARMYGAEGAGLYFLALTVATIAANIGCLGLNNTLLRFIAANAPIENWVAVKGVYSKGIKISLAASAILTILVFMLAPWLSADIFHKPELSSPLRWISFSIAPTAFILLQAEALRGLKRIQDWIFVSSVGVPIFSLIGLYFLGKNRGVVGAIESYGAATIMTAGIGFWLWRAATPNLRKISGHFDVGELLQSSMPLFWMSLLGTITNWSSILFLGIWATKADIGVYGTAFRISLAVSMIYSAINAISAPKFAELYKKKDLVAIDLIARQTAKLTTFMAGPPLLIFMLFPGFIMGIFGHEFRSGAIVLSILAAGQFVNAATGLVAYLLMMSGNERLLQDRSIFISFLCLILNLLLIPHWGILGAAIAMSITIAATNLIAAYLVWSKLGISTIPFITKNKSR